MAESTPPSSSSSSLELAEIGVLAPLAHSLTYLVPPSLQRTLQPGVRVVCRLGPRKTVGIVLEVGCRPPATIEPDKLKPISAQIDAEPILPAELLGFLRELGSYYFAPIGEVLRLALPALERPRLRELQAQGQLLPGEALSRVRQIGGRTLTYVAATDKVEQPGSLRGQAAAILALLRAVGAQPVAGLEQRFGGARSAVRKLTALGLTATEQRAVARQRLYTAETIARDTPPTLTTAQAAAVERLAAALGLGAAGAERSAAGRRSPSGFLLFGVTGSGKTEVYLRAIASCLAERRGALVLVPEIALTPQLLGRFRARFGDAVALLHSGLAATERHRMWQQLRAGELLVALGARSALFAPVQRLGLLVVDEEHDSSFKQEEGVRYHARDMALLRAHRAGAVAVLGSATPSLEALGLCRRGLLEQLELPERAIAAATLPQVQIVDLKRFKSGPTGDRLLSLPLYRAIGEVLAAGEQAIIFLNRRGFAPSIVCDGCGIIVSCPACSVALTFHRSAGGSMRCHYCDFSTPLPALCPVCRQGELILEGLGTEQLEQTIAAAFPAARVARLDRDVAPGAKSERVLDRMRDGHIDILVGTQMVTKGHDLPAVTLVGVVNADAALSMPDFRAAERGFQLLVQVAGRAGRRELPGKVIIQTRDPEHAAVRFAAAHDVPGFVQHELRDRRDAGYPPFSRLALIRVSSLSEEEARRGAAQAAAAARKTPDVASGAVEVLGPSAAPIARLRGRYRFRVLLRSRRRAALRRTLSAIASLSGRLDRRVRLHIDVDPVAML